MQDESPSKVRWAILSPKQQDTVLRGSLPVSRQSPPRLLHLTARSRPNSPEAGLRSPRHRLTDDLEQLRREIALRRQEQEQRSMELKRILPTDISETLTTELLHEDQDLPQCSHCLLL